MTRTFGAMSTVKLRAAGVGSRFPAGSVARTSNVWEPPSRDEVAVGELHDAYALESSLHSKLEPGSEEEKLKLGAGLLVAPLGPPTIVVFGGAVSTVKLRDAGVASVLLRGSVDRTSKVWEPSGSEP